jgi:glycosyltransferase involved in cell wall biosynthesis
MSTPLVSVILPTYNRAHLIERAVRSVLNQSFRDLELLVMDDASTDDSDEVLRRIGDPRIRHIRSASRLGPAAQRNRGIEAARGTLIAFQDSDDEWLAGKLEKQIERLSRLPEDFALTHCALLRHESGQATRLFNRLPPHNERDDIVRCNTEVFTQTWLARKSALQASGGFDERLHLWDDWEFLLRICQKFHVDGDDRVMCVVHDTPGSQIKQLHHRLAGMDLIIEKHDALMQRQPDALARNLYLAGRFHLMDGRTATGRSRLLHSLRLKPLQVRAWLLFVLALFGSSVARFALDGLRRMRLVRPARSGA